MQQFCFAICQKVLWDCFVIMLYDCKVEATLLLKPSETVLALEMLIVVQDMD